MSDKPIEEKPLDPNHVELVALGHRTTMAQAAQWLRAGVVTVTGDCTPELLERMRREAAEEDDVAVNAKAAKAKSTTTINRDFVQSGWDKDAEDKYADGAKGGQ